MIILLTAILTWSVVSIVCAVLWSLLRMPCKRREAAK